MSKETADDILNNLNNNRAIKWDGLNAQSQIEDRDKQLIEMASSSRLTEKNLRMEIYALGSEIERLTALVKAGEEKKPTFKCGRCGHDKKFWSVKNDAWYCDQCKYYIAGQ